MPRLKVFQAHLGFFDTVVAAPSQKAALAAWGSRQNLFHEGAARVATDPDAIKAALEKPGIVLKRMAGSKAGFVEEPPLPHPGRAPRVKPQPKTKPKPDRRKIERAEQALAELTRRREEMRAEFTAREKSLQQERSRREGEFERREAELTREIASLKED